jgi:F0F1-type ATP synthase membrane subunit b/b'
MSSFDTSMGTIFLTIFLLMVFSLMWGMTESILEKRSEKVNKNE